MPPLDAAWRLDHPDSGSARSLGERLAGKALVPAAVIAVGREKGPGRGGPYPLDRPPWRAVDAIGHQRVKARDRKGRREDVCAAGGAKLGHVGDISIGDGWVDIKKRSDAADLHPEALFAHDDVNTTVLADALLRIGEYAKFSLLWRKLIPMHRTFCRAANCLHELEATQTCTFIKQVFGRKVAQPKKFPPGHLLFAAVPVETMGEYPTRVLLGGCSTHLKRMRAGEACYPR
jgi:hypothetical protein